MQYIVTIEPGEGEMAEVEVQVVTATDDVSGDPVAAKRLGIWETNTESDTPHGIQLLDMICDGAADAIYDDFILHERPKGK